MICAPSTTCRFLTCVSVLSRPPSPNRPIWRRILRAAVLAVSTAAVILAAAYWQRAAILGWIGRQLIHEDPLRAASAIVVLSGGVPAREIEAADLYREGIAPIILLPHDPENSAAARLRERGVTMETALELRLRILRSLGVPNEAVVVLDPEVPSTDREAEVVAAYAASHRLQSLVVVTSGFHAGRVKFVYKRLFDRRQVPVAVRRSRADNNRPETWWHTRVGLRDGLIEWQKLLLYRFRW